MDTSKIQHLLLNTQQKIYHGHSRCRENIDVESFVYLRSVINIQGSSVQELRTASNGSGTVENMVTIRKSRGVILGLKVWFL